MVGFTERFDSIEDPSFALRRKDIHTVELYEISTEFLGEWLNHELPITYLRKFSIEGGAWEYFSEEMGAWKMMNREAWHWLNKQSELLLDYRV